MLAWIDNSAPYGVITTDREFVIQSWNRWMEVHSGKSAAAVVGANVFQLFPELSARGMEGRLSRALEGQVSVLSTALHGYLIDLPLSPGDSGFKQMQQTARIAPLQHAGEIVGTIIVIDDVSQRESQSLALRRRHQRDNILAWALAHLLESTAPRNSIRDLFCKIAGEFDFDTYMFYLRPAGAATYRLAAKGGISPKEESQFGILAADSPVGQALLAANSSCALNHLKEDRTGNAVLYQLLGFQACAILPIFSGADRVGLLCLATRTRVLLPPDEMELLSTISQYLAVAMAKEATAGQLHAAQVQLSQHARELERQVEDRTAKLREIIRELETFSHTLAHDLRAPIRALIGYCQALREDYSSALPERAQDIVTRLNHACQRLDVLTRDILELSRVSREEIHLAPVDLDGVVSDALLMCDAKSQFIEVKRPLLGVVAQRTLLQQCITNLVDNALKFIPPEATPRVAIWTEAASGSKVRIMVEDNGIGIAPEAQRKIFGIFERGLRAANYPGSGIGLAIVDRALQRMGGACGVESKVGVGSRFWLELPAVDGSPTTAPARDI